MHRPPSEEQQGSASLVWIKVLAAETVPRSQSSKWKMPSTGVYLCCCTAMCCQQSSFVFAFPPVWLSSRLHYLQNRLPSFFLSFFIFLCLRAFQHCTNLILQMGSPVLCNSLPECVTLNNVKLMKLWVELKLPCCPFFPRPAAWRACRTPTHFPL